MLEVQKYLKSFVSYKEAISKLKEVYSIKVKEYDDRIVLNYDQINSQKNIPITNECRALILSLPDFEVLSRSFDRFYNFGECGVDTFDFENSVILEKVDGSLFPIYFDGNKWNIQTRGTAFAESEAGDRTPWLKIVLKALNFNSEEDFFAELERNLYKYRDYTFICELCSLHNRVVKLYKEPTVYLLSARNKLNGSYMNLKKAHEVFSKVSSEVKLPIFYEFSSYEEILKGFESFDSLDEGVVCWNRKTDERVKIKRSEYLSLHRLKGAEGGIPGPKDIVNLIVENEQEETLTYFPEFKEEFAKWEEAYHGYLFFIEEIYGHIQHIETQKDFALEAMKYKSVAGMLFDLRKNGVRIFPGYNDSVLKELFKSLSLAKRVEALEPFKE